MFNLKISCFYEESHFQVENQAICEQQGFRFEKPVFWWCIKVPYWKSGISMNHQCWNSKIRWWFHDVPMFQIVQVMSFDEVSGFSTWNQVFFMIHLCFYIEIQNFWWLICKMYNDHRLVLIKSFFHIINHVFFLIKQYNILKVHYNGITWKSVKYHDHSTFCLLQKFPLVLSFNSFKH